MDASVACDTPKTLLTKTIEPKKRNLKSTFCVFPRAVSKRSVSNATGGSAYVATGNHRAVPLDEIQQLEWSEWLLSEGGYGKQALYDRQPEVAGVQEGPVAQQLFHLRVNAHREQEPGGEEQETGV
jgi:hypothetical protein